MPEPTVRIPRSKTFRGALLELLVVVAGILLAVQVDAWNQRRLDHETAASYLSRLQEDLRQDSIALASLRDYAEGGMATTDRLLGALNESRMPDSVGLWIAAARNTSFFEPRVSSYQDMVSTGRLDLIRDVTLRDLLVQYHEVENGDWLVAWSNHLRRTHWEQYASYLPTHVDPRTIPANAEGIVAMEFVTGWEAFRRDPKIRAALLDIWAVRDGSAGQYRRRLTLATDLIQRIDSVASR